MDRTEDGSEGQPGPELMPGGSYDVHSWIEDASGDGKRVSWFAPQNQGARRWLKMPSRGGTGVGLEIDGGDGRRRRLGPRCGRGGDGRRAASRAVRRPRRERRLGPRRGGENLPARGVLAVFLKTGHLPGFRGPPKTANRIFTDMAASRRRLRVEERNSAVGWDRVNISGSAPTGILDTSLSLGVFWTLRGHHKYLSPLSLTLSASTQHTNAAAASGARLFPLSLSCSSLFPLRIGGMYS